MRKSSWYFRFSKAAARFAGRPVVFALAAFALVAWAVSGPVFGFSDTWQLVVNTGTTIITFLMVFLIQNTQNRDTAAMQVKLDELIRVTKGAQMELIDVEELDDESLEAFRAKYEALAARIREKLDDEDGDAGATDPS